MSKSMVAKGLVFALLVGGSLVYGPVSAEASTPIVNSDPIVQAQINAQIKKYGGEQVGPNVVSYKSGTVRVVFPDANGVISVNTATQGITTAAVKATTAAVKASSSTHNCPSGFTKKWYCFYAEKDWRGRMVQFSDLYPRGS